MPLTLDEAYRPAVKQGLAALSGLVAKAEAHVHAAGTDPADLYAARLAPDMWTLPWHVRACWMHSGYAATRMAGGVFTPDFSNVPQDWDAMRAMIDEAAAGLDALEAEGLEAIAGETVDFVWDGKRLMSFTVQDFLLSFSLPNFYFHAATFYDILRMKGVDLGKPDFLGPMRMLP